jgi:hypothetical protein
MGQDSSVGIATGCGLDGPAIESLPISVAERSKARVCGRWLAGVASLNPAGLMDVCVCALQVKTRGKMQDSEDTETSTEEVPSTRECKTKKSR